MNDCDGLCRIGELAREAEVPTSTVHYYCQMGLLEPASYSSGGYRLFKKEDCVEKIRIIKEAVNSKPTLKDLRMQLAAK